MNWAAMNWLAPLFAADPAWPQVVAFIVAIAIYAINHLVGGLRKPAAGKPPRIPPPRPMPPPAQQPQPPIAAEPVTQRRQELNAELNDFLRRAAQKRGEIPPASPALPAPAPQPSKAPRKRRKSATPTTAEPAKVEKPLTMRRSLSTLDTSAFDNRSGQLSNLPRTDEIQEHVQETFNRQLGNLSSAMDTATSGLATPPGDQPTEQPITPAASLFTLLRDPQSLRGAIMLNEILARPEHRW